MSTVQLMLLGLILAAFGVFMFTLLSVSIYVSAGKQPAKEPLARVVTPARRAD